MRPRALADSDANPDESYPVFPIFVVLDVSLSMSPVMDAVNGSFEELTKIAKQDPTVGEISRIGVVSFAESATTELGLADLRFASVPWLETRENRTNFAVAFRHLYEEIETSIRALGKGARYYTPVVFFVTDGEHNVAGDDWHTARDSLVSPKYKLHPEIVAIGFNDASEASIREISTRYAFLARDHFDLGTQVQEMFKLLIRSIRTNSQSAATAAASGGAMRFEVEADQDTWVELKPMTN